MTTNINSVDWAGNNCVLVDSKTKAPIALGAKMDIGRDGKKEMVKVVGGSAPHKPESTGRVYVKGKWEAQYFPSVINAQWRRV